METLLKLSGLSKSYGGLKVIDDIDLVVKQGETLGILGPNGAGKTTLFNLISGDILASSGTIEYEGEDITRLSAYKRCRLGIGRTYQIPQPFGHLTTFENLVTAACFGAGHTERDAWTVAEHIMVQSGLVQYANMLAGSLTLLNRKRLELARALATEPRFILLDEIAGGLTEPETHALLRQITRIKENDITIIWIEHVVHALLTVADRLLVLDLGRTLALGKPENVMIDPKVRHVYMGMDV